MANRHTHKKLRAEIRARRSATGESYQQARARILSRAALPSRARTDLVAFSYFGFPFTLATIEAHGLSMFALVPSATLWGRRDLYPFPLPRLQGLPRARGVR